MTRLHLGCGEKYLEGYINIDFPVSEHTVLKGLVADEYADIQGLVYPSNSLDEIRLHHVFEHFSRPVALALLCRWRNWLQPGGMVRIETPDAMASIRLMMSPLYSFDSKQQVMRHLFGSHEAAWAVHADGWYREKFRITLEQLGFEGITFATSKWSMLRNIEVIAHKGQHDFTFDEYFGAVRTLLLPSTVRTVRVMMENDRQPVGDELTLLDEWMMHWKKVYEIE